MPVSPFARFCALLIALAAMVSIGMRFVVIYDEIGRVFGAIWHLARYFTLLTNALAVVIFADIALSGRMGNERWLTGLVLWVGAAGLAYHWLLSRLWMPEGLTYWADQGLHSVVPAAVFLWWLVFAGRRRLEILDPFWWLAWPVGYLVYALIRSAFDGIYAYPFLDPGKVAPSQLIWTLSRLLEGFAVGGYLLLWLSRIKQGRASGPVPPAVATREPGTPAGGERPAPSTLHAAQTDVR